MLNAPSLGAPQLKKDQSSSALYLYEEQINMHHHEGGKKMQRLAQRITTSMLQRITT
jgi:hypothetical protein